MLLSRIFAVSLLFICTSAWSDAVDINLRDNSAQLQYSASMGRDTLGRSELHAGFLYVDKDNRLGDIGILVQDEVGERVPGLSVGAGIKGLTAKAQRFNATALAIGGMVKYAPLANRRFSIVGELYLSPNIVTFGDADRYVETNVRFEYELIPQASAYIGYRKINFGLENYPVDAVLDEGAHLGLRIMF